MRYEGSSKLAKHQTVKTNKENSQINQREVDHLKREGSKNSSSILQSANKNVIAKVLSSKFKLEKLQSIIIQEEKKNSEEFRVHGKCVEYDVKSLYIFGNQSKARQLAVWLIEWRHFEYFIIAMIIANSVIIAMFDQLDRQSKTFYNQVLEKIQTGLTVIFTIEAIIRIIGMGLIKHKHSYLRNYWYWLDLFTITVGWLEFFPSIPNLKLIRTLRVLRPLRSMHAIPGLKRLINSLLKSFTLLANVVTFLAFFIAFLGIVGVGFFKSNSYNRCHLTASPLNGTWEIDPSQNFLCSQTTVGYRCLEGTYCGNPNQVGLQITPDYLDDLIAYGMSSFDNFFISSSTIFQIITMDGWSVVMFNMQDSGMVVESSLFFIFIILFGTLFLLNLVLAAIMDSFEKVDKETVSDEIKREFREVELEAQKSLSSKKSIFQQKFFEGSDIQSRQALGIAEQDSIMTDQNLKDVQFDKSIRILEGPVEDEQERRMENSCQAKDIQSESDSIFSKEAGPESQAIEQKPVNQDLEYQETYNSDQKEEIQERSKRNCLFRVSFFIVSHRHFVAFIMMAIIGNTFCLFLEKYPMSKKETTNLEIANFMFFGIFFSEMLLKVCGFGPKNYIRDQYNLFDMTIVMFSMIEIVLMESSNSPNIQKALIAFRTMRFLRIFKIARKWRSLQIILQKMKRSLSEMLNFLILLFLFIFIYALLGMELYANLVKFDSNNSPVLCEEDNLEQCAEQGSSLRSNFDNFQNSLTTVFVVILGYLWTDLQANYVRGTSKASILYFTSLTIMGNIVMLNLFLAILLRQFKISEEEQQLENESAVQQAWVSVQARLSKISNYRWFRKLSSCLSKKQKIGFVSSGALNQGEVCFNEIQVPDDMSRNNNEDKQMPSLQSNQESGSDMNKQRPKLTRFQSDLNVSNSKSSRALIKLESSYVGDDNDPDFTRCEFINAPKIESFSKARTHGKQNPVEQKRKSSFFESNPHKQSEVEIPKININPQELSSSPQAKNNDLSIFKRQIHEHFKQEIFPDLEGKSLNLFSVNNQFRILMTKIVIRKEFKAFILLNVVFSSVNLALQLPLTDPNSKYNLTLYYIDLTISLIFVVECLMKSVSRGFIMNGRNSYLRNHWSQFDFVIVVTSLISFITTSDTKVTKLLRTLRVVRPLRLIPQHYGLQVAVISLIKSIKGIINVTVMMAFIFSVWGIFGVNFFKGLYFNCFTDPLAGTSISNLFDQMETKWDCINSGGEWVKNKNTFDNVFEAAFMLYQISTTQGWVELMNVAVDATKIDYIPITNNSTYVTVFFIAFILIGGLFTINLFQGVVISTYLNEKEKLSNNHVLSQMQKEWVHIEIKIYKSTPSIKEPMVKQGFNQICLNITSNRRFHLFIYVCIVLNFIICSINWYGMPQDIHSNLSIVNHSFTAIFIIEAALKIIGHGKLYFRKFWNLFDFIVLILTLIQIIYSVSNGGFNLPIHATILKIMKLLKQMRMANGAKSFKKIAMTLFITLPKLANIALLLLLLVVFYSIMGMNVFGKVMLHNDLDHHSNFQTFTGSFLTMFKCVTGEKWNFLMVALMDQRSIVFQCLDSPDYSDILNNNGEGIACGNYWSSVLFFLSFQMLVCRIFLNLFLAIILDGFDDSKEDIELRIDDTMIKLFNKEWVQYDQEGTGFISIEQLEEFIQKLVIDETKWIRGGGILLVSQKQLRKFISIMELPMYNNFKSVNYYDVLTHLALTMFKVDFERVIIDNQYPNSIGPKYDETINQLENSGAFLNIPQSRDGEQSFQQKQTQREIAEDAKKQSEDLMRWMTVKDHLMFETFEEFYQDILTKAQKQGMKIVLYEELYYLQKQRDRKLMQNRSPYDTRILPMVSVLVKQMRKLIQGRAEKKQKIEEIKEAPQDLFQHHVRIASNSRKNRDDLFQILAKTHNNEKQEAVIISSKRLFLSSSSVQPQQGSDCHEEESKTAPNKPRMQPIISVVEDET